MTRNNKLSPDASNRPRPAKKPKNAGTGKRIGKSKVAKADNQLNRRLK